MIDLMSFPSFSRSQIRILESIEVETRPNFNILIIQDYNTKFQLFYLRVPSTETSTEITPIACPSSVNFNSPEEASLNRITRT